MPFGYLAIRILFLGHPIVTLLIDAYLRSAIIQIMEESNSEYPVVTLHGSVIVLRCYGRRMQEEWKEPQTEAFWNAVTK